MSSDADSQNQELHFGLLLGESEGFRRVLATVPLVAQSDATVLISGETGTGKDLVARAIHYQSQRRDHPFIPVSGALPDHLCENELFGHAKGAFTDASSTEKGLIAEAEGGTLFLNEVDTLSPSTQAKLLRFLEVREYRPLGSSMAVIANVRVIAATNRDLPQLVRENHFRDDLFYRLCVLSLALPPLRDRIEDIPLLAEYFVNSYAAQYGRVGLQLSSEAFQKLSAYHWPGNIRELKGVIERALILCASKTLQAEDLDLPNGHGIEACTANTLQQAKSRAVAQFEREYVTRLLHDHKGNVTHAAKAAGKERRAFQRLLHKYRVDRNAFRALS